jgi:hypothetical protein
MAEKAVRWFPVSLESALIFASSLITQYVPIMKPVTRFVRLLENSWIRQLISKSWNIVPAGAQAIRLRRTRKVDFKISFCKKIVV